MKILVTGGAGFIGSTMSQHLLDSGHEVIVLDNLEHGFEAAIPSQATLVKGDIGDQTVLDQVMSDDLDAVMHFAALIQAGESMLEPEKYFENNASRSLTLYTKMLEHGVDTLVFSSTAAVYASKETPIAETDPLGPANAYGETKLMSETILKWLNQTKGLNVGILRYFNASGASLLGDSRVRGQSPIGATHLIPNILKVPLGQKDKLVINGTDYDTPDGTCVRDYIHVDDLCTAHLKVLERLTSGQMKYDIFNLGNGNGYSIKQVLDTAREVTGHEIPVEYGERREGDASSLVSQSSKANEVLQWQPQHDLKAIIESAWDWHRTHPNGYEQ